MTDDFVDPGEPGELTGRLKAKDLINKPLIIRPLEVRHDGEGKDDAGNPKAYTYVKCDVWVLDRAGVVEKGEGVRFSWVRVLPQLEDRVGQFVAGTPVVQDDNSRVLQPFTEGGKEIARKVIAEIKAETAAEIRAEGEPPPIDDDEFSSDPF
jgi:hypothetical protein